MIHFPGFAFACLLLLLGLANSLMAQLPRTILFADDDDILYRPGTIKRVVEFKRHSPDPVIVPDKPWEAMLGWTSVYRDPQTGRHQLWYQAYQERRTEDKVLKNVVCYAESDRRRDVDKTEPRPAFHSTR